MKKVVNDMIGYVETPPEPQKKMSLGGKLFNAFAVCVVSTAIVTAAVVGIEREEAYEENRRKADVQFWNGTGQVAQNAQTNTVKMTERQFANELAVLNNNEKDVDIVNLP